MIVELGHAGLWVEDLAAMKDFYRDVIGLSVTDEDETIGLVFLSSRPEREHHELVLARGRTAPRGVRLVNQLSWRLDSLDSLLEYSQRFDRLNVPVVQRVTHGNALGVYFEDPEGNENEVYWPTDVPVPQPYRKSIDLRGSAADVLAAAAALLADDSPTSRRPQ